MSLPEVHWRIIPFRNENPCIVEATNPSLHVRKIFTPCLPPMTGNGSQSSPMANRDDWGMVLLWHCLTHIPWDPGYPTIMNGIPLWLSYQRWWDNHAYIGMKFSWDSWKINSIHRERRIASSFFYGLWSIWHLIWDDSYHPCGFYHGAPCLWSRPKPRGTRQRRPRRGPTAVTLMLPCRNMEKTWNMLVFWRIVVANSKG